MATDQRIKFGIIASTYANFKIISKTYEKHWLGFESDWLNDYLLQRAGKMASFPVDSINPADFAKKIKQPVLMIHGTMDPQINVENTNIVFRNLASKNKKVIFVTQARHNDVFLTGGNKLFDKIYLFLEKK